MTDPLKQGEYEDRSADSARPLQPVARFAWFCTGYNIAVILWGAYVRATGSGAGCGNRWPLCNGNLLPSTAQSQTLIEFLHRATSGVALVLVSILLPWCWRRTSKGHWARYSALSAMLLLLNEALLGALLVLLDYVGVDRSTGHALFLCLHFGNTLLLLAALTLTARWLSSGGDSRLRVSARPYDCALVGLGLISTIVVGMTGSLAALADTLFPSGSLVNALTQDISPTSPILVRLRLFHPIGAIIGGAYVMWMLWKLSRKRQTSPWILSVLITILLAQIGLGLMNVILLTPIWLQLPHLLVAELFWIVVVLGSSDALLAKRTCVTQRAASRKLSWSLRTTNARLSGYDI